MHKFKMLAIRYSTQYLSVMVLTLMFFLILSGPTSGDNNIDVKRDKDKTVYIIDSKNDQKEDKDKENAWEMLKKNNLWIKEK